MTDPCEEFQNLTGLQIEKKIEIKDQEACDAAALIGIHDTAFDKEITNEDSPTNMDATITDLNVISSLEQVEKESILAHTQNTVVNEAATLFDSILNGEQSLKTLADGHSLSII